VNGTDAPDAAPVVRVSGLTKRYGGTPVLQRVSFAVRAGEVHALLGENGAGKSTIIKILSGVVRADDGTVELAGLPAEITSPRTAAELGIATLHQEHAVVPGLTVAENILLGHPLPTRFGKVRWREVNARARRLLDDLGQSLDVAQDIERVSPVGRTMVALARALSHEARLLVLDEPTASLTDAETRQLFATMERLKARGVAILYVSHRLEEVLDVCDTYSVLRNGELVASGLVADATIPGIITAMTGRAVDAVFPERHDQRGGVLLDVDGLSGRRVHDLSFEVHEGEVFGIAGLAGSGRSEVVRLLAGAQARRRGTVRLRGEPHAPGSVSAAHRTGVALVPQERRAEGILPDSVERNANITTLARHTWGRLVMSRRKAHSHARGVTERLRVRHHSLGQDVLTLSGGNQQKVVLGKILALSPDLLLLDEPTKGVDVGTKSEIYHLIRERAANGLGVVMVSSELPEVLGLCDRILVLHEGRPMGVFDAHSTTEDELLHACYGTPA
jgi:ABC-type sugar transport system ATPase subunit